eukprot:TRINITY_DN8261_c0_g1_i1.p1 TRINITY_DN8261_c0_g1~~TRINITY_DN8261_c0_g1_i1.p1  ORF type:complete len:497 (-),score=103.56 TRINITY_DN8261_c0_g1_i1:91-1581(-)
MSGYTQVPQQGDSAYGQGYAAPVYGQPAYGQPGYAPPVYGQPYEAKSPAVALVHHSKEERFPEQPQYRDLPFLLLFFAHLVITILIFGIGYGKYKNLTNGINDVVTASNSTTSNSGSGDDANFTTPVIICAIVGGLFSAIWIMLIRKFSGFIVQFSIGCALALYLVAALVYFILGLTGVAVVFLVVGLINILIVFIWRNRIAFAKEVLKCVAEIVDLYPAPIWVSIVSIVPMWLYCFFWIYAFSYSQYFGSGGDTINYVLYTYLVFSYFWTTQVIKNVVHVTASGVFASWYFLANNMPHNPTLASLKRAVTTSFGSVCLGSLLVALIKTAKALLSRRGGLLGAILSCLLSIIDQLLQYFNRYAFAQVAIYGKTFCQSAKSTWNMFMEHGFEAIINDDITGMVLTTGCVVCGLFTALVGGLIGDAMYGSSGTLVAVVGFFIGFSIALLVMEVIDAGVATIFVCFVEEPERLRESNPHFYQKFSETYGDKCSIFHHHA